MARVHWARLKCVRNSFYYEFDKRFKYVGNDVNICERAQVFEKRLNYVGNDLDRLKYVGNDVYMWERA